MINGPQTPEIYEISSIFSYTLVDPLFYFSSPIPAHPPHQEAVPGMETHGGPVPALVVLSLPRCDEILRKLPLGNRILIVLISIVHLAPVCTYDS